MQPEHFWCQTSCVVCPAVRVFLVIRPILTLPSTIVTTLLLHRFGCVEYILEWAFLFGRRRRFGRWPAEQRVPDRFTPQLSIWRLKVLILVAAEFLRAIANGITDAHVSFNCPFSLPFTSTYSSSIQLQRTRPYDIQQIYSVLGFLHLSSSETIFSNTKRNRIRLFNRISPRPHCSCLLYRLHGRILAG